VWKKIFHFQQLVRALANTQPTGDKRYCFQESGKRFSGASSLTKHKRTHSGEKTFSW